MNQAKYFRSDAKGKRHAEMTSKGTLFGTLN